MNQVSAHIPPHWSATLWLIIIGLFCLIGLRARWRMLMVPANLNVFLAATVVVLGLWLIRTGIRPGLDFHLLGATLLTLMFRPWFALLALALVCALLTTHNGEFNAYPANLLIMGALPVTVSWLIYRLADSRLPNHLFIYIFINGFLGGALSIAATGIAATLFATLTNSYTPAYLLDEYLPFYLLMAWAEGLSTGMITTLLVIYRPEWVATFDDRRYLNAR